MTTCAQSRSPIKNPLDSAITIITEIQIVVSLKYSTAVKAVCDIRHELVISRPSETHEACISAGDLGCIRMCRTLK